MRPEDMSRPELVERVKMLELLLDRVFDSPVEALQGIAAHQRKKDLEVTK